MEAYFYQQLAADVEEGRRPKAQADRIAAEFEAAEERWAAKQEAEEFLRNQERELNIA